MNGAGIVRDDLFIEHDPGSWHPESPDRLKAIYGLLDSREWPGLITLEPRQATREEIILAHTPEHFERMAATRGKAETAIDADTHTSAKSFDAALYATGGLISLTEKVLEGQLSNGFALVRPPGHHAEANRAMGFCLFNNVAVASAWALEHKGVERIMVVDWDLHHGNGTQHIFYDDPRLLYFSTHQYPYYPGSGGLGEIGRSPGLGYTVNVPLRGGQGDEEYLAIMQRIAVPLARQYKPEIIMVSTGFDTYSGDPLGGMNVTTEGFAAMTRVLKGLAEEVCGGRLVLTLEGGYNINGQTKSVEKVLDVLTGSGPAGLELAAQERPEPIILSKVREAHQGFWNL